MVFNIIVGGLGLLLASVEDIKKREVPDLISFALIGIGLLSSVILSISFVDFRYILFSVSGIVVTAIIGAIFYYSGQWGGGDFKLVMGIGSLLGLNIFNLNVFPLLLLFLINIFIVGAVIGLIYVITLAIKNRKKFSAEFYKLRTTKESKSVRKMFLIFVPVVILLLLVLPVNFILKFVLIIIIALAYFSYYLSLFIRAVEKSSMIRKIPISKLTEGDWIVGKVKLKGNKFLNPGKTGLSTEDITTLKKNKIKSVVIKEGMPFVPSFLVAYVLTFVIGNWFVLLR